MEESGYIQSVQEQMRLSFLNPAYHLLFFENRKKETRPKETSSRAFNRFPTLNILLTKLIEIPLK